MSEKDELKARVEAKRKRIEARLAELKADTSSEARDESRKLQAKLDSLEEQLKGGWDDLTEAVAGKLNAWLADDDR